MDLQEVLSKVGDDGAAVINAAIEAERNKGVAESRRKGEEVKKHLTEANRLKDALRDTLGIEYSPDIDLTEALASVKAGSSKGKSSTDDKLAREVERLRKQFEEKEKSEQSLRQQLTNKKLSDVLSQKMRDQFHGADLIVKDFISSGRVKLLDDETVIGIDGDEEVDVDKLIETYRKARPDLVKNTQTGGSGSHPTRTTNTNRNTMLLADFNKLRPVDKALFMKNGGRLVE
jgi:hypothetical protein